MNSKVWMIHYFENGEYVWRPLTQERVDAVRNRAKKKNEEADHVQA